MAFIWNSEPNFPAPVPPLVIGPEETSFKVHVVANTVNIGGAVSYNTPNVGYDVVYEIDSLNVRNMRVQTGIIERANIGTAIINIATINIATINTANITNATINIGFFTGNATANFSMVTKEYVDNAIASISGGSGPDTTANLITTKGDLLVGFAPNTAHRFGVGIDGQVLSVSSANTLKQKWGNVAATQSTAGLHIGTHYHPTLKFSQVLLRHVDGITMDDGELVSGWDSLVADITVSGPGGRDSVSAEAADTWYEVWAIRNSNSGAKALLLHRMLDHSTTAQYVNPFNSAGTQCYLRRGEPALTIPAMRSISKISQSFVTTTSASISSIAILSARTVGSNEAHMWVSLQGDDGLGNADGSIIATSESQLITQMSGQVAEMNFVFDTAVAVSSGSRYHMVFEGDWTIGTDANSTSQSLYGNTAPLGPGQQNWMANVGYTSGNLTINSGYGDCRLYNVITGTWMVAANAAGVGFGPSDLFFKVYTEGHNTGLSLPTGYNQKALISYVVNNASSNFKEYQQLDRTLTMGYDDDWSAFTSNAALSVVVFFLPLRLDTVVPPVACTVKFLGTNPSDGGTDFILGFRTSFGLPTDSFTDSTIGPYGHAGFGAGDFKSLLSHQMSLDKHQIVNMRAFSGIANATLHVVGITF